MEKPFDARSILVDHLDFARCQRPDGSYYGTSGVCRKGVNAPLTEDEKNAVGALASYAGTDAKSLEARYQEFQSITDAYEAKIAAGDLTYDEVSSMIVNDHGYDLSKAEFAIVGMEPTGGGISMTRELAGKLAVQEMVRNGATLDEASTAQRVSWAGTRMAAGQQSKVNSYEGIASNAASQLTGNGPLPRSEMLGTYAGGRRMGTVEMSAVAAKTVGDGGKGKMDPTRSSYGLFAQQKDSRVAALDRSAVSRQFGSTRAASVKSELETAARGKMKGAVAVPGGGGKYNTFRKGVVDEFARQGSRAWTLQHQETTGQGAKTNNHTVHVVELAPGRYMVSANYSMNRAGYSSKNVMNTYREAIRRVEAGDAERYTPPAV